MAGTGTWGLLVGAGGVLLFVLSSPPAPKATMPVAMNHVSAQRFGFPGAPREAPNGAVSGSVPPAFHIPRWLWSTSSEEGTLCLAHTLG